MCFIYTSIRLTKDDNLLYPLAKILATEQASNKQGTGSYCFNTEGDEVSYNRSMSETWSDMVDNLNKFDVVNYHFRQATEGIVDVSNVHYWKEGIWLFAHNGIIGKFGEKDKKSDSLEFFETMIGLGLIRDNGWINCKRIKNYTNSISFSGRFMLINAVSKKMYFFGDWNTYLINRSYMVIASSSCSFENLINVLGINYEIDNAVELETLNTDIDGIWSYDTKKGFRQIDTEFKVFKSYYPDKKTEKETIVEERKLLSASDIDTDDDEYWDKYHELTTAYEEKIQELSQLGYSDAVLTQIDRLDKKYMQDLKDLDEEFLTGEKAVIRIIDKKYEDENILAPLM
jgi:hypothetical protein